MCNFPEFYSPFETPYQATHRPLECTVSITILRSRVHLPLRRLWSSFCKEQEDQCLWPSDGVEFPGYTTSGFRVRTPVRWVNGTCFARNSQREFHGTQWPCPGCPYQHGESNRNQLPLGSGCAWSCKCRASSDAFGAVSHIVLVGCRAVHKRMRLFYHQSCDLFVLISFYSLLLPTLLLVMIVVCWCLLWLIIAGVFVRLVEWFSPQPVWIPLLAHQTLALHPKTMAYCWYVSNMWYISCWHFWLC